MRSLDDVEALVAFFEARSGRLHGFRWKDWSDYKSCLPSATVAFDDQMIGQGDGETRTFQLSKVYRSGQEAYARPIRKPVTGTILVGVQGDPQVETVHYTVDAAKGAVTFGTTPDAGVVVTAGFEFDVPVRFDTDLIQTSVASFQAGDMPSVPVIEVRA
jgi:uncharacterized protein (TIGR02217 family)